MKKIWVIVLAVILILTLSLTSAAFGAGGGKAVALAQEAGQAWLDSTAAFIGEPVEWVGAHVTAPQVCYDLEGKPSAYIFAMENDGQVVGHVIVGSSAYGYPVFEAGEAAPPSIPSADEVKSTLERDLGLKVQEIGKPTRLLYLGWNNLFAVYQADRQEVAMNLLFDRATPVANLTSAMASPEDYEAARKATGEALSDLSGSSDYSSLSLPQFGYKTVYMTYYGYPGDCGCGSGGQGHLCCMCGPSSGEAIGKYYRTQVDRNKDGVKDYAGLPGDNNTYDRLYDTMGADSNGEIWPWNYGPGFVAMADDYYSNFNYYSVFWPSHGYYENIVSWINLGWPTAICATQFADDKSANQQFPPSGGHCVAIRGYYYDQPMSRYWVVVVDSFSKQNALFLDWDHMTTGFPPYDITIWDSYF